MLEREDLEDFANNSEMHGNLKMDLLANAEDIQCTLYRGMAIGDRILEVGGMIPQWGECTHWTRDKKIALEFSSPISDEQVDLAEGESLIKVILVVQGLHGVDLCKLLEEHDIEGYEHEQEVLCLDYSFRIEHIEKDTGEYEGVYMLYCEPIQMRNCKRSVKDCEFLESCPNYKFGYFKLREFTPTFLHEVRNIVEMSEIRENYRDYRWCINPYISYRQLRIIVDIVSWNIKVKERQMDMLSRIVYDDETLADIEDKVAFILTK